MQATFILHVMSRAENFTSAATNGGKRGATEQGVRRLPPYKYTRNVPMNEVYIISSVSKLVHANIFRQKKKKLGHFVGRTLVHNRIEQISVN